MNFLAFDELKVRITTRLLEKGSTTGKTLALELGAPEANVRFALEMLRNGKEKFVESWGTDMWDVTAEYRKKKKLP
jgi:hypothetical protein